MSINIYFMLTYNDTKIIIFYIMSNILDIYFQKFQFIFLFMDKTEQVCGDYFDYSPHLCGN